MGNGDLALRVGVLPIVLPVFSYFWLRGALLAARRGLHAKTRRKKRRETRAAQTI